MFHVKHETSGEGEAGMPGAELDMSKGFTIGIFFPKEAPPEVVQRVLDKVSEAVYGELTQDRVGWDPFMVGHPGDLHQIEAPCECCDPHVYLSTSCFHGDHNYCKRETGLLGNKIPGVCKFCQAPCVCGCHGERKTQDR